jgi:signal transduction histidine kinase/DNA-binding response OmpR family regulator
MKKLVFQKADLWIERILRYPGIDEKELTLRKDFWSSGVFLFFAIGGATLAGVFYAPHLKILIAYGCFQVFLKIILIVSGLFLHRDLGKVIFVNQLLIAVVTFLFILKLGGIAHSGGLVLVGIFQIFFSFDFKRIYHTLWLFTIYIITVVVAGILDPFLTAAPEMTRSTNNIMLVVNICWISGFALFYVLNFIKQSVRIEMLKTEKLRDIDEAKTKLYTNITHELRSPLTIILSTAAQMRDKPDEGLENGIRKIENSGRTMLHFINQMLEIKKIEAGIMPLNMIQSDIILYLKNLTEQFFPIAYDKNILLRFSADRNSFFMDFDPEKMMHIVTNLLSNALKYTERGGTVNFMVESKEQQPPELELRISDNGPGIQEDQLPFIFDRFYRVESASSYKPTGTGLGLAITRELVKLLDGNIGVTSVFGEGTEFVIKLPVKNKSFLSESPGRFEPDESMAEILIHNTRRMNTSEMTEDSADEKPLLLISEDNEDVLHYLISFLRENYHIVLAKNGIEASRKAIELIPDIILTDLIMPEMDGLVFLDMIKHDNRTSHIPVVVLTARADDSTRLSGLKRGADAFLLKPFNREELEIVLAKLIESRKTLKERYSSIEEFRRLMAESRHPEDTFMSKFHEIVNLNISDEDFDIHKLCRELAMSRTQLYRKFRSLTDKPISHYIRSIRLHKARELLTTSKVKVSESAYLTGFKNLSHFSRAFTEEFGINPSDVAKQSANLPEDIS